MWTFSELASRCGPQIASRSFSTHKSSQANLSKSSKPYFLSMFPVKLKRGQLNILGPQLRGRFGRKVGLQQICSFKRSCPALRARRFCQYYFFVTTWQMYQVIDALLNGGKTEVSSLWNGAS
jgi:hypothetical protein